MRSLYIYLFLFVGSLIICVSYYKFGLNQHEYAEVFQNIWSTGLAGSISAIAVFTQDHSSALLLALRCRLFKRDSSVYVSLSYLFKIKLPGSNKYLMVKSRKIKNQYQPVGGVFKKYPSLTETWRKWEASSANNYEINADDLRFSTMRKHIPSIRRWFQTRKNREVDVWREFYEELIVSGILPANKFKHIRPEYLYSKEEHLITRKGIEGAQFLIYEIYSVDLTTEQKEELINLCNQKHVTGKYAFVDEADLDRELFYHQSKEKQLGYHARYLKP